MSLFCLQLWLGEEVGCWLGLANSGLWDVPQSPAEAGGAQSGMSPPGPAPTGWGGDA